MSSIISTEHKVGNMTYELKEEVKRTNISTIYHAKKGQFDFAVKIPNDNDYERNKKIITFSAETQKKLNHHNIIKIVDIVEIEDKTAVVMEYFPYPTLDEIIKKSPISFLKSLDILIQVVEALEYAHLNNITHGDVHPTNILVSDYCVKVTDFGYNPEFDPFVVENSIVSTSLPPYVFHENYIAPEQQKEKKPSKSADVYSLGLIARKLWTGLDPPPKYKKTVKEENPHLPESIEKICEACFVEAENRATMREVKNILLDIKEEYQKKLSGSIDSILEDQTIDLFDLAETKLKQKNVEEAEKIYEAILKLSPNEPRAICSLLNFYVCTNKIDKATSLFKQKKELIIKDKKVEDLIKKIIISSLILRKKDYSDMIVLEDLNFFSNLSIIKEIERYLSCKEKKKKQHITENIQKKLEKNNNYYQAALTYFFCEEYRKSIELLHKAFYFKQSALYKGVILAIARKTGIENITELYSNFSAPFKDKVYMELFAQNIIKICDKKKKFSKKDLEFLKFLFSAERIQKQLEFSNHPKKEQHI
ncbi:MAG: protein kinase [Candidatus Woesearchaeota archaeon]